MIKYFILREYTDHNRCLISEIKDIYYGLNEKQFTLLYKNFEKNRICGKLLYIYFGMAEEISYTGFMDILRDIFYTLNPYDYKEIINMTKKDDKWWTIPFTKQNYGECSVYDSYKIKWDICNKDFVKYFKVLGLCIVSAKWREKFKSLRPLYIYNWKKPLPIKDDIAKALKETYILEINKSEENMKNLYWPLVTSMVNDEVVREDKEYLIISASDILKIDYLTSHILDEKDKNIFLKNIAHSFMVHSYNKVKEMKWKLYNKSEIYRNRLDSAIKKKRVYN